MLVTLSPEFSFADYREGKSALDVAGVSANITIAKAKLFFTPKDVYDYTSDDGETVGVFLEMPYGVLNIEWKSEEPSVLAHASLHSA